MDTKGIERQLIVGFDHSKADKPILIVGEIKDKEVNVIRAFSDRLATDIYYLLTADSKHAEKKIRKMDNLINRCKALHDQGYSNYAISVDTNLDEDAVCAYLELAEKFAQE